MKRLGIVFTLIGIALVPIAFFLQSQQNSQKYVDSLVEAMGGPAPGTPSPLPWILGIGGVVLVIVGLILIASGSTQEKAAAMSARAISPGWHEDPESPTRLRYHDGVAWTDRTADKS